MIDKLLDLSGASELGRDIGEFANDLGAPEALDQALDDPGSGKAGEQQLDARGNSSMPTSHTADKLFDLLDSARAPYRLVSHAPEGRTAPASAARGHRLNQAAKAMVLLAAKTNNAPRYFLAVVSGDRFVDLEAIRLLSGSDSVALAPRQRAEELTGCPMGGVPPFSFHPDLTLIVDPGLLLNDTIVLSAARLDQSIYLSSADYIALAQPTICEITTTARSCSH